MNTRSRLGYVLAAVMMAAGMLLSASAAQAAPEARHLNQGEVAIEADIFVDDDFTTDTPGWGVTHFDTIQAGVDAALSGSTITVAAGVYTEQVVVTKNLSLLGAGPESIIKAYSAMPVCFVTPSGDNHPIVCVKDNAIATINGFLIDGLGLGAVNHRLNGVGFHNAGGTIQNLTIQGIRDEQFSGVQRGVGIYVYNEDTTLYTVNVFDNTIQDFQKNAMALNAADNTPLIVDVERNTVIGHGATNITAQNGIQVWAKMGTGKVIDNVISGIGYDNTQDPTKWVGTSILNFDAELETSGNTVTGAQVGVYYIDGFGLIDNNQISIDKIGVSSFGIVASDPPDALPSPYSELTKQISISAVEPQSNHLVEISNNEVLFDFLQNEYGTFGVEADAGYGSFNLDINIHHNLIRGFGTGIYFYQCSPTEQCTGTTFASITIKSNNIDDSNTAIAYNEFVTTDSQVHYNRLFNDFDMQSTGMSSSPLATVYAEYNWWGCNPGPINQAMGCSFLDAPGEKVLFLPPIALTITPVSKLFVGQTVPIFADLLHTEAGEDLPAGAGVLDGIEIRFYSEAGIVNPDLAPTKDSIATSSYQAPLISRYDGVCAALDATEVCTGFQVIPNDIPVANPQNVETGEDIPLAIVLTATDVYPGTLTWSHSQPQHGTLTGDAPNLTYTPNPDWNGEDSFTFKVNDGSSDSNEAVVVITVNSINDAPVAPVISNPAWLARELHTLTISPFTDIDGDTLTYTVTTADDTPPPSWLNFDPLTLTFSGTPANSDEGDVVIKVTASDGTAQVSATFTITVVLNPYIYYLPILGK